jgi:serine/threonine-protein kinase
LTVLQSRLSDALGDAYVVEGEIGRGGMGVVYRARDIKLKRPVAIKVLPPDLAFRPDIRTRFLREAETAARLSHPNIVPIHSVGEKDDLVYFIMGLVDGESLASRIKRRGRLAIEEARRIMREASDALSAAHQQGVIHRDVKPDNILLEGTRGRVVVTDFGIAKALTSEGGTLTEAGVAIGTPAFMSPEQAAGDREIDGRSDLYSLGVVAYQMITGELPFQAPSVPALLMKQITENPVSVERKRPETPKEFALSVMRCLEKDPEDRWPTADALRRALETNTYTAPPPRSPVVPRRRSPGTQGAASVAGMDMVADRLRQTAGRLERRADRASRRLETMDRKELRKAQEEREIEELAKRSGEPVIVTRFRHRFTTYIAVNVMLLALNAVTTHFSPPWALFPLIGWGFGIARGYASLWNAGYSWRDVANRPPAPDAFETKSGRVSGRGFMPRATTEEFGSYAAGIQQSRADRAAVLGMLERMSKAERQMLPEIAPTVDQLLERATDHARTLAALERDLDEGSLERIEQRIAAIQGEEGSSDRERRVALLQQQHQKVEQLVQRRGMMRSRLDSCLLAMQNVRFDLLRLRSAGVSEALGDLTQATQQAKALSRDVDAAIGAASEIRRLTGNDRSPLP